MIVWAAHCSQQRATHPHAYLSPSSCFLRVDVLDEKVIIKVLKERYVAKQIYVPPPPNIIATTPILSRNTHLMRASFHNLANIAPSTEPHHRCRSLPSLSLSLSLPLHKTYVGDIILAVNPFEDLPIYKPAVQSLYLSGTRDEKPPHLYHLAYDGYEVRLLL
jgi:hypothetical protein